jgi:hypothetical protein
MGHPSIKPGGKIPPLIAQKKKSLLFTISTWKKNIVLMPVEIDAQLMDYH